MSLDARRIAEIEASVNATTPGVWMLDWDNMVVSAPAGVVFEAEPWNYTLDRREDFEFITDAPQYVRELLAEVRRYEAMLEGVTILV